MSKVFDLGSPLARALGRHGQRLVAVDDINLRVAPGESLGIVGESGSGKSVTADLILALQQPTGGVIRYGGEDINGFTRERMVAYRKAVQIVFQNPYDALNPTKRIRKSLVEPLEIHHACEADGRDPRAARVLEEVGLAPAHAYLGRFPHELSGGEIQRVAIARALMLDPELVVADEPTSMLDVSVRAGVLNLLRDLRRRRGLSLVFISHDFSTIRYICDRTAVMQAGEVVEIGPTREVIENHRHPYTAALISAVPVPGDGLRRERVLLSGQRHDPTSAAVGCRYAGRCPHRHPRCDAEHPELTKVGADHYAACHLLNTQHNERDGRPAGDRQLVETTVRGPEDKR